MIPSSDRSLGETESMNPQIVTLERYELELARYVGIQRNGRGNDDGRGLRFQEKYTGESYANHILAAMAEIAVAKFMCSYWSGSVDTFTSLPDVMPNIEVRWTRMQKAKVKENDTHKIVCVTGNEPTFTIQGYIWPERGMQIGSRESFNKGKPAWFIPFELLSDPLDLIADKHVQLRSASND
jgi:hypothetical protein